MCIITRAPRSPEERARSVEARARMIERGGYGFGKRAAALLGSVAAADTLALVQQTLRATNPAGFPVKNVSVTRSPMPMQKDCRRRPRDHEGRSGTAGLPDYFRAHGVRGLE